MKTAIQQVLEYIESEMYKVANNSSKDGVSKIQEQFYAGSYSTFAKILLELEVNFLEKEKDQIINAYADGRISVINKEIISYQKYYDSKFSHQYE